MDEIIRDHTSRSSSSNTARDHATTGNSLAPENIAGDFVQRVPIGFARRFDVLGLISDNGRMPVAIASRDHLHALDKITVLLGVATVPLWHSETEIQAAINRAYGTLESGVDAVIDGLPAQTADALLTDWSRFDDLLDSDDATPVTRLVNLILFDAVKRRASDVHIQPFETSLQVRLRVDGVLVDYVQPPKHLLEEIVSRIKVMGRMNIAEKRLAQDGRTTVMVGEKTIDLRISTLPTCYGERVVLRLLDKSARLYGLEDLGMGPRDFSVIRRLVGRTYGIMLVTGPTGSGKSTTLYAALQELDCRALNILTLEDPIEYQLPGISQTQITDKKGMTFATGLRTVLRQDPDVIMVGEIRDEETARMAIQSSLTGHLVFSTLHTNDAAGAVARLLDLGVEPYLVAGSLHGVLAQRLVRRVCAACRLAGVLSPEEASRLRITEKGPGARIFTAAGCEACHGAGYRDRVGVFEMLEVTDALQRLIADKAPSEALKRAAMTEGMSTIRDDAIAKLRAGVTTVEEVLRVTHE